MWYDSSHLHNKRKKNVILENVYVYIVKNQAIKVTCRTPLHEDCLKHHIRHKRDPKVTFGTCGAIIERVQVIIV